MEAEDQFHYPEVKKNNVFRKLEDETIVFISGVVQGLRYVFSSGPIEYLIKIIIRSPVEKVSHEVLHMLDCFEWIVNKKLKFKTFAHQNLEISQLLELFVCLIVLHLYQLKFGLIHIVLLQNLELLNFGMLVPESLKVIRSIDSCRLLYFLG